MTAGLANAEVRNVDAAAAAGWQFSTERLYEAMSLLALIGSFKL